MKRINYSFSNRKEYIKIVNVLGNERTDLNNITI
jgi:hypothetical protein